MRKPFEDEIKTQSGITFYKDVHFDPEWSATVTGHIVAVPKRLSGKPEYRGLSIEGEQGEEVIVSYLVVYSGDVRNRDSFQHNNLFYHEGNYYWKCDRSHIKGFIRNGEIVAGQGFVFMQPLEEKKDERIGLIWLPEMTAKEKPKGKARVVSVGTPKKGEPELSLKEGEVVRFSERFAEKYEILGKQYLIIPQQYLLATEN